MGAGKLRRQEVLMSPVNGLTVNPNNLDRSSAFLIRLIWGPGRAGASAAP